MTAGAHLIPGLLIDLTILDHQIAGLGIVMDSSVGAVVSLEKSVTCPSNVVDVSLYTEQEIRVEFNAIEFEKTWPIVNTGQVPVKNLSPCLLDQNLMSIFHPFNSFKNGFFNRKEITKSFNTALPALR
jgi:hypothetical protein